MKYLALLAIFLALPALAQSPPPTAPAPNLALTRTEIMEWENIQLKYADLNRQIEALQEAQARLRAQLTQLESTVLTSRSLVGADWAINWQGTKADPIPKLAEKPKNEAAKK